MSELMIKTPVIRRILWTVPLLLLLCAIPDQGGAASIGSEPYNVQEDPAVVQGGWASEPLRWDVIWDLVREFEGIPYLPRAQSPWLYAPPQPEHYVQSPSPPQLSPMAPEVFMYDYPFLFPYYDDGPWSYRWWEGSPKIPWWRLFPFTEHDEFIHGPGHHGPGGRGHGPHR